MATKTDGQMKVLVFWENWFSNLYPFSRAIDLSLEETTRYLLKLLEKYGYQVTFYCLGTTTESHPKLYAKILSSPHKIDSHGYEHVSALCRNVVMRPNVWLGLTGGFWFRVLPLWLLKKQVRKTGHFYIHPYDIDENHPHTGNWWFDWKRHVGLKGSRKKLEKLLEDITD